MMKCTCAKAMVAFLLVASVAVGFNDEQASAHGCYRLFACDVIPGCHPFFAASVEYKKLWPGNATGGTDIFERLISNCGSITVYEEPDCVEEVTTAPIGMQVPNAQCHHWV